MGPTNPGDVLRSVNMLARPPMSAPPSTPARLSSTEGSVVAALLGTSLETEGERIDRSGLPRSTFQDAKRRIYARGFVSDRYVPAPPVFGTRWATAVLARPYAEEMGPLVDRWRQVPGNVVLWKGLHTVFGLFLHPEPSLEMPKPTSPGIANPSPLTRLTVDLLRPTIPIYFDFEGAWANISGGMSLWQYPRPLVLVPESKEALASGGSRKIAADLVGRTGDGSGTESERAPHRMGPHALPRSARRMVERGWLQWRTFPRLASLALSDGRGVESAVILYATLKEGRTAPALFRELVVRRSFPFLLMTDGARVTAGFLSSKLPVAGGNPHAAAQVLTEHLTQVEAYREPTTDLQEVVCHRYGGILGVPPG